VFLALLKKQAYGLNSIVLVKVDISSLEVTGVETPPPHVFWGDIPTPLFRELHRCTVQGSDRLLP
jgi:hypothetical protein